MKYFILLIPIIFLTACDNLSITQGVTMLQVCQNLHKVEDVDDLIKQFYDNIDSHCLFEMDTKELERIWGIRVFDFYDKTSRKNKDKLINDLHDYTKNKDGIYIKKFRLKSEIILRISPTNSYMTRNNDTWEGSLGLGQFPKYLPKPEKYRLYLLRYHAHLWC